MGIETTILALLIIGIAFMVLEAFVPAFGLLGLGGMISFLTALYMARHQEALYGIPVDTPLLLALALTGLVVLAASFYFVKKSRLAALSAGAETMIDAHVRVIDWQGTKGRVYFEGEEWAASGPEGITSNDIVIIKDRNHLTLSVTKETP